MKKFILFLLAAANLVHAGSPVWNITPLTETRISLPQNDSAVVRYFITNKSRKSHTLAMNAIPGITQDTSSGNCSNPFTLGYQQSCTLKLNITGSELTGNVNGGPIVCEQASNGLQCYQPSANYILNITLTAPETTATIAVTGSPLNLTAEGAYGTMTVTNNSKLVTATNVVPVLASTNLDGNVTVDASSCSSILPLQSCTITFTPLSTAVATTNFAIQGDNTTTTTGTITIAPATVANISVANSPLYLYTQGIQRSMVVTNNSNVVTATNVVPVLALTNLDGNVTVASSGCTSIAPGGTCTLTFTPSSTVVSATSFNIQGTNTTAIPASITIAQSATLSVTDSPLYLYTGGNARTLTVTNSSPDLTATNVTAQLTDSLVGNVAVAYNGCGSILPGGMCTISFTPSTTVVGLTSIKIQGSNTNVASASIEIQSPATLTSISSTSGSSIGGLSVTLTGTNLLGATGVLFDGVAATDVNIVDSSTVRAVTPPHALGVVNVQVTTSGDSATLNNAFTYIPTAVGQSAYGGKIACVNGSLNNLIAANVDNSAGVTWGPSTVAILEGQSHTDGLSNTNTIVNCLTNGIGCYSAPPNPLLTLTSYAAGICKNYEIDSQGNSPCLIGNTCYKDWFMPAGISNNASTSQLYCLYQNRVAIGGFTNSYYWSSAISPSQNSGAYLVDFNAGSSLYTARIYPFKVRCVRNFRPYIAPNSGSASGGLGVTITGTNFTNATRVTFDGVEATSVNVVNSTTITAVTPPHIAGAVNVQITTPSGAITLPDTFTYLATDFGQWAYGGRIACLNGGLNNLIAAPSDNANNLLWGGYGTTTGATSTTNGDSNTSKIVSVLGNNGGTLYAAQYCADYEIDSQGNSPCVLGNTCYKDWFLPSGNNNTSTGQLYCLYLNSDSIELYAPNYWSSTEASNNNAFNLSYTGNNGNISKNSTGRNVRCVRAFTPAPTAPLTVTGSPLIFITNGTTKSLTITNTSSDVPATNVTAQIAGTALEGKVIVDSSNCTSIAPLGSCNLNFTPLATVVLGTNFNITGDNTTATSASIAITPPVSITVTGSPLTLYTSGIAKTLTIKNTSTVYTAYNVVPQLTNTALAGKVTVTSSGCDSLGPLRSCTISFTPLSTIVSATNFPISGDNTLAVDASITIAQSVPITVTGSPLYLYTNGSPRVLTINNTSSSLTATNVVTQLPTSLAGKVTVTRSGCASIAPLGNCTMSFTPLSTVVSATSFTINGDNTTVANASITISASATLKVTGSPFPMTLNANGVTKTVTITNTSSTITASNVAAQITGTALAGNVTVAYTGCTTIVPGGSCTISFKPLSTVVSATSFNIEGANTTVIPANITIAESATLTVTGSPMNLFTNGAAKSLTITNTSSTLTATNVMPKLTDTALAGNVTVTSNGCGSILPGGTCTIDFTPLNTVVSATSFPISGDNTSAPTASVTIVLPIANLIVTGSPLYLYTGGATGTLTVTNSTPDLTATNVTAQLTGSLVGNVTLAYNGCTSIASGATCTISFTPSTTVVALTSFNIQGTNTNVASASVAIQSPATLTSISATSGSNSGGLGVTLTGTNLLGVNAVLFDGIQATDVYAVNSTTVKAVTPPHAAGAVNVQVTTSGGSATLSNGFTYLTTAVGQSAYGGKIACISGGLNSLIAATVDNSTNITWNGSGVTTAATSNIDGNANTNAIVNCLSYGTGCTPPTPLLSLTSYAAGICKSYSIDSQGNSPCVAGSGNTCYNDWFLPSSNNNNTSTGQLYCLYANRAAIGLSAQNYWGSTERNGTTAYYLAYASANTTANQAKTTTGVYVKCVRAFAPPIAPQSGSASGGLGVTITGANFTSPATVTFDGVQATSVKVVNSTTITAVTPAHAAGAVTVIVTTPKGALTVSEPFTYVATAFGQYAYGGRIACTNGGLNNLIVSNFDFINTSSLGNLTWGGSGIATGATSTTDGATNTNTIVTALGSNGGTPYAAQSCKNYQVDSQGNTPCVTGNTCYTNWFLPADSNNTSTGQLNCLYTNRVAIGLSSSNVYWSSTESSSTLAWAESFSNGGSGQPSKTTTANLTRCVRAFP